MGNCEADSSQENEEKKSNPSMTDRKIFIMDQPESKVSVSDFPLICRICLARTDVIPLEHTLSGLFRKITNIQLDPNDKLPRNFCNDCIRQLQDIWDFIELSKISNASLQNIYKKQTVLVCSSQEQSDIENEDDRWETLGNEDTLNEQSDDDKDVKPDLQFKTEESNEYGENAEYSERIRHVCTICGKTFKIVTNLIKHNKNIHNNDKPFKCEICCKEFALLSSWKQHSCKPSKTETSLDLEHNSQTNDLQEYECNVCRESFICLTSYQQHIEKHETTESYECGTCHKIFSQKTFLEKHIHKHIKQSSSHAQDVECEHCGKQFPSKKTLYDHLPIHTKQFQCEICDKVCTKKFHLENHHKLHSGEKPYQCEFCDRSFRLKSAQKAHHRVHTGERPYQCRLCKKTFAQKSNVVDHERRHTKSTNLKEKMVIDRVNEISTNNSDEIKNTSGNDNTWNTDSVFSHLEKKSNTKIQKLKSEGDVFYSCEKCEGTFTSKREYRSHMIQHDESPDISDNKCRICNKVFSSKYNMQSHMVIHNETRNFLCNICGKGFSKKVYLDTHSLIHSGEKPYECKECGKSFRQRSTYNRHILVHTDERSFGCDQCDKTFQQKTHLTRHQMVHTGEKRFQCGYCGKKFGQNVNLKTHVRTHTGETAFHCSICGKGFYDSSSLKKHVKGHAKSGSTSEIVP